MASIRAPSRAHRRAIAFPIPDVAPVTKTARPSRFPMGAIAYDRATVPSTATTRRVGDGDGTQT